MSTPSELTIVAFSVENEEQAWLTHGQPSERATAVLAVLEASGGRNATSILFRYTVEFGDPVSALVACAALAEPQCAAGPCAVESLSIGVHTQRVHPSTSTSDVEGIVQKALRVQDAAHPGQVLCSAATAEVAGNDPYLDLELIHLGPWRLLDFDRPEDLYQLAGPYFRREFPPPIAGPRNAPNLPLVDAAFIGREREVSEIIALVEDSPLVTIVGTGGIGKTRIAYEVARRLAPRLPGGAVVVHLADVTSNDEVLARVADSMGVQEQAGEPLIDSVLAVLDRRTILFVLDNSERVTEQIVALIERVMQAVAQIRILVTSRRRLGKVYESVYTLGTLETPFVGISTADMESVDAVRFFVDRYAASGGRVVFSEFGLEAIGRICRHLEGLPLAIELVAARSAVRPVEEVADEIDGTWVSSTGIGSRFEMLQELISTTIQWNLSQLSIAERLVFARLSVFRGRFECADAEVVAGFSPLTPAVVRAGIASLIEASLLVVEPAGHLRLLAVIREGASAILESAGETGIARDAHLRFFSALFDRTPDALSGPNQVEWSNRIDVEIENIRAALEWGIRGSGNHDQATRLAASLESYWIRHAVRSEGRSWLEESLVAATGLDRVNALVALGRFALEMADYGPASRWLSEGVELAGQIGTTARRAHALGWLGVLEWYQGDYVQATTRLMDALGISEKCSDGHGEALWHTALGALAGSCSDYAGARSHHQAALAISELGGDKWILATARGNLGDVAAQCGDLLTAEANMRLAIEITREIGDRSSEGHWSANLGLVAMSNGDYAGATNHLWEGIAIAQEVGDRVRESWWLSALAEVAAAQGDTDEAQRFATRTLEVSFASATSRAKGMLAFLARAAGDLDTAKRESMAALAALNPDRWLLTTSLVLVGASLGGESAILMGASLSAWNEESGSVLGLPHAQWMSESLAEARESMTSEAFDGLWSEGTRIPIDKVAAIVASRQQTQN